MATLPVSTNLTGSAVTEAQAKTWFTQLRDFLSGLLGTAGTIPVALATLQVPFAQGFGLVSGAYSVKTADRGKVIGIGAAVTVTLPAAATAGSGFMIAVHSFANGAVVDGSGAGLIDGAATMTLNTGESAILVCNSVEWWTVGRSVDRTVTLAAGSLVYAEDSAVVTTGWGGLTENIYGSGLAAKSSESAIATWLGAHQGNAKAIKMYHGGTVTVNFDIKNMAGTSYVRLAKNTSLEQEWLVNNTSYVTRTLNVTVNAGDILLLQFRGNDRTAPFVQNFKVLVAKLP